MKNPIVELTKDALARFERFRAANADFFPSQGNLYPIPFFGDIRKATRAYRGAKSSMDGIPGGPPLDSEA
jgi:hypothetical protein